MILKFHGGWDFPRDFECWNCGKAFQACCRNARWCPECRIKLGKGHGKKKRYEVYANRGHTETQGDKLKGEKPCQWSMGWANGNPNT